MVNRKFKLAMLATLVLLSCITVPRPASSPEPAQAPTLEVLQPTRTEEAEFTYDRSDGYEIIRAVDFALRNNQPEILVDMVKQDGVFYSRFEGEGNTSATRQEFHDALLQRMGNGATCQGYVFVDYRPWMMVWVEGWNPAWSQTESCDVSGCYALDEPWESESTGFVFDGESGEWELIGVYNNQPLANDLTACNQVLSSSQEAPHTGTAILFQDDFSNTSSGWDRTTFSGGETDYQNGAYHIFVGDDYSSVWANPGLHFADVRVEADAVMIGGVEDNEFGVICRYVDVNNFYAGSISSDGYYAIVSIKDGEFGYVGSESMQASGLINLGATVNRVRLDCVGSRLTLYVNGKELLSVSDSSFSSGDVGLYAGTFATPGIDISFDNFAVYQP